MTRARLRSIANHLSLTLTLTLGIVSGAALAQNADSQLDTLASHYVKLVLAMGEHDPAYVDAYYGPAQWREDVHSNPLALEDIAGDAEALQQQLAAMAAPEDDMEQLRISYLHTQLGALAAYASRYGQSGPRNFDQEARSLYDTAPPRHELSSYDGVLAKLEQLVPGSGDLPQRMTVFYRQYEIPAARLAAVFEAAIAECRQRTVQHIALPAGESFALEYVQDKPWSGYNWYQGGAHSLIQVNTTLPVRIDRAIDLGCHEGYPGHHTYNALLEATLVQDRGWVEFSVYPLFSPQSLIAEGSANYGIELAFPGTEKTTFEQQVLYPLAGIDPALAARYDEVQALTAELNFARNEIARQYMAQAISREEAIALLQKYGPASADRASQSLRFIDSYGAYVINYNWGKQLVQDYIERGTSDNDSAQRWRKFADLLASPRLPSELTGGQ